MPSWPPAAPAWPTDNCPPEVLNGKVPFASKLLARMKSRAFAFAAEAEVLELKHADHRVIVIDLEKVDVVGADARLCVKSDRGP